MTYNVPTDAEITVQRDDPKAAELRKQVRTFLDERGYKGDERKNWWQEFRKLAREQHGIDL